MQLTHRLLSSSFVLSIAMLLPRVASGESPPRYEVTKLASLGGTVSSGNSINDRALIAGTSNLAGDTSQHAAAWLGSLIFDLGTLGGPNSGIIWPVKNGRGVLSGIAETSRDQPRGERWSCSAFFPSLSGKTCLGVVWEGGHPRALPTLGGDNGFATGTNNRRQTVGWAENTVHDSTCVAPQVLQFHAVMWGPEEGQMAELPPLARDTSSAATAINDHAQVVGISGICDRAVGRFSAIHAVLWEHGTPVDLGTLGGVAWNTPMAINESGVVVGFGNHSAADGGTFNAHAFIWTPQDGIRDLGTLPGDALSEALGINNRGQVVGLSCTAGFASCRGFLWENGAMVDMNSLVDRAFGEPIVAAGDIDDSGRITGQSFNAATNVTSAVLAVPMQDGGH
jgi:probable HAF family extracellular repeat protein